MTIFEIVLKQESNPIARIQKIVGKFIFFCNKEGYIRSSLDFSWDCADGIISMGIR